jgi:hypothetical protein
MCVPRITAPPSTRCLIDHPPKARGPADRSGCCDFGEHVPPTGSSGARQPDQNLSKSPSRPRSKRSDAYRQARRRLDRRWVDVPSRQFAFVCHQCVHTARAAAAHKPLPTPSRPQNSENSHRGLPPDRRLSEDRDDHEHGHQGDGNAECAHQRELHHADKSGVRDSAGDRVGRDESSEYCGDIDISHTLRLYRDPSRWRPASEWDTVGRPVSGTFCERLTQVWRATCRRPQRRVLNSNAG